MEDPNQRREIDLHRRVCVVQPGRIDIRPARSAAIVPLLGLFLGVAAFVVVLLFLEQLPLLVALLLMGVAILLVPLSGMGFVYAVFGASVVVDRKKQSAVWQQGLLGMGVGTRDVVPFGSIERIEVKEVDRDPQELAQYEVLLLKTNGRELSLGQASAPREAAAEAHARAREAAEAVASLVGKPIHTAEEGGRPRRRRRSRSKRPDRANA